MTIKKLKEFCDLYNGKEIEKNRLDYIDFALNEKINNNDKKYWLAKFNDTIPLLNMPTDYERGNIKSEEGDSIFDSLTQKDEIHEFCKKLQITPYMLKELQRLLKEKARLEKMLKK